MLKTLHLQCSSTIEYSIHVFWQLVDHYLSIFQFVDTVTYIELKEIEWQCYWKTNAAFEGFVDERIQLEAFPKHCYQNLNFQAKKDRIIVIIIIAFPWTVSQEGMLQVNLCILYNSCTFLY